MAPYIGTATSRVDGRAKVTGAAKYAAEFNAPDLAHGERRWLDDRQGVHRRIDISAAMRVHGVLAVLTHKNRPPLPDKDKAYQDEVAPEGSPYRPLYDGKILFGGQPVALVIAETSEAARFAATLVEVEYDKQPHVTDIYDQRDAAEPVKSRPSRWARRSGAAIRKRRWRPRRCGTMANISCRSSTTTRWSSMPRP